MCRTHCDHANNYPFGISNFKEEQFLLLYWLYPEPRRSLVLAVRLVISRTQKNTSSCCNIDNIQNPEDQQFLLLDQLYPEPRRSLVLVVILVISRTQKSTSSYCYMQSLEGQQFLLLDQLYSEPGRTLVLAVISVISRNRYNSFFLVLFWCYLVPTRMPFKAL